MKTYPSWRRINATLYVSEEQVDGVPDLTVMRDSETKRWHVTSRVSAHWQGETFETADAAKAHAARMFDR